MNTSIFYPLQKFTIHNSTLWYYKFYNLYANTWESAVKAGSYTNVILARSISLVACSGCIREVEERAFALIHCNEAIYHCISLHRPLVLWYKDSETVSRLFMYVLLSTLLPLDLVGWKEGVVWITLKKHVKQLFKSSLNRKLLDGPLLALVFFINHLVRPMK